MYPPTSWLHLAGASILLNKRELGRIVPHTLSSRAFAAIYVLPAKELDVCRVVL